MGCIRQQFIAFILYKAFIIQATEDIQYFDSNKQ